MKHVWMAAALVLAGCSGGDESTSSAQKNEASEVRSVGLSPGTLGRPNFDRYRRNLEVIERVDRGDMVAASIGDWRLRLSDIDRRAGADHQRRLKMIYAERFRVMENMLAEKLYEMEGRSMGLSAEALFDQKMRELDYKPDPMLGAGMGPDERMQLIEDKATEALYKHHQDYVAELALKHELIVAMREPGHLDGISLDDAASNELVFGKADSPVLVEVYTDLQCPHCANAAQAIDQLLDAYRGRARFVYRLMTSPERPGSRPAAIYASCMYKQSPQQFLDFQSYIFANQGELSGGERALRQLLMRIGSDMSSIDNCTVDPDVRASLDVGVQVAMERGISSTPTVIIAGVPVVGAQEYQEYQRVMEAALDQLVREGSSAAGR